MQLLKKTLTGAALATSLVLVSGVASAATYNVGELTKFTDVVVKPGIGGDDTFADTFKFSVGDKFKLNATLSEISAAGLPTILNLDALSGNLYKLVNGSWTAMNLGTSLSGSGVLSGSFSSGVLEAGQYRLNVSGILSGLFGGGYGLSLNANPVPEPSEYLMMLAGLGVIGFAVRRKRAQ
ncbi:FxDxF family PEP-CTERM protein [Chitinivorax sp. B]|uniref:FxDxF family PEP-CTERM protein n=1 Tax=Chitinivorax sp. B TaxID=2502235 RepID=UPI001484E1A8|nr:FxDxF family PEP-CTERM protein [Chitinivorax sp. B]